MDGSVNVFLDHFLRNHDGVFEVVAIPRHERDEHISAERELTLIGIRTIGNDLSAFHVLAFAHNRFLIHARAGI